MSLVGFGKTEIISITCTHELPGNFRDLQRVGFHVLAAVLADQDDEQVVAVAKKALRPPEAMHLATRRDLPTNGGLRPWLDDQERSWLRKAMEQGGNKTNAAELLDMPRKTFEAHCRKLCENG